MASLGQLTSGIAHEINNPINYISSSIDGLNYVIEEVKHLLTEYDKILVGTDEQRVNQIKEELEYDEILKGFDELTSNIKLGIDRSKEIVNSLRTFSRVDEDNFTPVDINKSIDSAIILIGKHHSERITIIKDYSELPRVECISGKINQVFLNILVNAIQAIKENGEIIISTSKETNRNKDYVKICISDTGVGIPNDLKDRIFEPFYTTKDVGEGTGLGLSITYSIIKKHKAKIKVLSELNKGSTFIIYLPIKQT